MKTIVFLIPFKMPLMSFFLKSTAANVNSV